MEGKLIKTVTDNYILVDLTKEFYGEGYILGTSVESDAPRLSLTNCQAIERGYDLYELAEKEYLDGYDTTKLCRTCFKDGFQKALEILGDKKFTEDDIRKAIKSSRKGFMQQQHNGYGMPTHSMFVLNDLSSDDIIQSLEQTEWDVTFNPEELDAEGRLILKRKL